MAFFRAASVVLLLLMGPVAATAPAAAPPGQSGPAPAAAPPAPPEASRTLKAVVSIAPLRGLIEPLLPAGSMVDVLIPPGASEHGYEIPPAKLAAITRADLIVTVGLGLEPQIEQFIRKNPSDKRLALSMSDLLGIHPDAHDHAHHQHGPDGECLHEGADPHLWLDPALASEFVRKLAARLAERFPDAAGKEHPATAAAEKLCKRIDEIDRQYREAAQNAETRVIVVGHDAYGRLARRYSLTTIAIAGLNAQEPTNKAVQAAIAAIRQRGAKAVFVEPQLSQAAGKRIAQRTGVPVLTIDPLGSGDWFAMMEANLKALKQGLGTKSPADDRNE